MNFRRKRWWLLGLVLSALLYWLWLARAPHYEYAQHPLPADFEAYCQAQQQESQRLNARIGNEEKLIRFAPKTGLAFVYIHGFTASRAEGEHVVDSLATLYQANTYYLRLPGHGTNKENHASTSFSEYLDAAIDALVMARELGDTVVVIGTSMGGLVATYIAASQPQLVDALILTSPFYDYGNGMGHLLKVPGVLRLIQWMDGPERPMGKDTAWLAKIEDGYNDHWYPEQLYQSLQSLEDLRNFAARKAVFEKVTQPLLLLFYYKDENHQDGAASVAAMKAAYGQFASTRRHDPRNKLVNIPEGEHVMTSKYVKADKATVLSEMQQFLQRLRAGK